MMHSTPFLALVDPRAQRRAAVLHRVVPLAVGLLIAGLSAVPFVLALPS